MKKIIITGGCGFIGSALVERLNSYKIAPIIIDIKPPTSAMSGLKFEYKRLDVVARNSSILNLFRSSYLTVVHLAAMHHIPECNKYPHDCFRTNVYGTYNIVKLVEKSKGSRLIFSSSGAVYPPSSSNLSESAGLKPDDIYGETKRLGENIIQWHLPGRHKIFRVFNVYGHKDGTPHLIPSIVHQLRKGVKLRLGNLRTERDYIFITDVSTFFTEEIIRERSGTIYNIGTGVGSSAEHIITTIEKILNQPISVRSESSLRRAVDKTRLVSNPDKARKDYAIDEFITLEQGLSLLLKTKI